MNNHRFFKGLIFDLNGTVIELYKKSEYYEVLDKYIEFFNVDKQKFKDAWHTSWKHYLCGDYPSVEDRFLDTLKIYYGTDDFELPDNSLEKAVKLRIEFVSKQLLQIKDHVIESFEWAQKKGYKLGMITNCTIETQILWKNNPLSKYIPNPSFSCELHQRKPNTAIFENECKKIGIKPEKCIYIADGDDNEFEGAKKLGMERILVKYDENDTFRVLPFPKERYYINSFHEFPNMINKIEEIKANRDIQKILS